MGIARLLPRGQYRRRGTELSSMFGQKRKGQSMRDDFAERYTAAITAGFVFGIAIGVITWMYAPPVGGEYWPYIRVGAAMIAGYLGAQIGVMIGMMRQ